MGFPRKNDGMRVYRDTDGSYFAVFPEMRERDGSFDALANVYPGPRPSLVGTSVSPTYIARHWLKRFQWDELPPEWREAFLRRLAPVLDGDPEFHPESIRGLWRIGNQPES